MNRCTISLYLASSSPRRAALLTQIGVDFTPLQVNVAEQPRHDETPQKYVKRLAVAKADAGRAVAEHPWPVLGADTCVAVQHNILGKPDNKLHATQMLRQLSGKTHQVMTAVALWAQGEMHVVLSVTDVTVAELSDDEIARYWQTGEPQDKAGGYAIQGYGAVFIKHIHGSYSAVVGLPLFETYQLLKNKLMAY